MIFLAISHLWALQPQEATSLHQHHRKLLMSCLKLVPFFQHRRSLEVKVEKVEVEKEVKIRVAKEGGEDNPLLRDQVMAKNLQLILIIPSPLKILKVKVIQCSPQHLCKKLLLWPSLCFFMMKWKEQILFNVFSISKVEHFVS